MKKKKVLFIIWSFSYGGGAERILANIVNNLNYDKYDIEVLEYLHADKMESIDNRVKICRPIIDTTKNSRVIKIYGKVMDKIAIKVCPKLVRAMRLNKTYDVEIAFNYLIPTFLLSRKSGKLIAWNHGAVYDLENMPLMKAKQRKVLRYVDKIVAISNETEKSIITEFPEYKNKIAKIYNGYDFNRMQSQERVEGYQVLFCNRFDRNKNPFRFVRAIKKLRDNGLIVTAVMLGTGELFDDTLELIKEYKLEEQITCLGYQKNPYAYYENCKVFCLTSYSEGFPTTLIEAMYFGKPFVSTPVAGADELSNNGLCGFIEDNEDAYIDRIVQLLKNQNLYKRMSNNCKNHVLDYSLDKQIKTIEKYIDEE